MRRRLPLAVSALVVCACVVDAPSDPRLDTLPEPRALGEPPCDRAAPCIDETRGVFVRAAATGDALGTRARPFGSLRAALAGRGDKPYVFVCSGRYEENVLLRDMRVVVVGGLDCATFEPGSSPTRIAPRDGYPVDVAGASVVAIVDVELVAPTRSRSSVAAWIHDGANVVLQRARLRSGRGAEGVSAPTPPHCLPFARTPALEEPGAVLEDEWIPADAPDGEAGTGCGGRGGSAGGASVGILLRAATLVANNVYIATERGGHGGSGGDGLGSGGGGAGGASGVQAGISWIGVGALLWNGTSITDSRTELDGITLHDLIPTPGFGGEGGADGGAPGRLGTVYAPLAVRKLP